MVDDGLEFLSGVLAQIFSNPVEDHHRIVNAVPDDRQQPGDEHEVYLQVEISSQEGKEGDDHQGIVYQGDYRADTVAEGTGQLAKGEGDVEQDADGSNHHGDGRPLGLFLGHRVGDEVETGGAGEPQVF